MGAARSRVLSGLDASAASNPYAADGEEDRDGEGVRCRICFEGGTLGSPLLVPCECTQGHVHRECLLQWMETVLLSSAGEEPPRQPRHLGSLGGLSLGGGEAGRCHQGEQRHLRCQACRAVFRGVTPPSGTEILSRMVGPEIAGGIREGSLLVATRQMSRPLHVAHGANQSVVESWFHLRRAHWMYSVYYVYKVVEPCVTGELGEPDGEVEESRDAMRRRDESTGAVYALNLTRQQALQGCGGGVNSRRCCNSLPSSVADILGRSPSCCMEHHVGGPVEWGLARGHQALLLEETPKEDEVRLRAASRPKSQSGWRWASAVKEAVRRRRSEAHLPDGARCVTYGNGQRVVVGRTDGMVEHCESAGIQNRLISFSGYARWGKDQLLREIARGSWGVISKDDALPPELVKFFRGDATLRERDDAQEPATGSCRACRLLLSGKQSNPLWESLHPQSLSMNK